ncbi:MAG: hypothetical protein ACRDRJ_25565 [Streptosporangiaceae bacterium]
MPNSLNVIVAEGSERSAVSFAVVRLTVAVSLPGPSVTFAFTDLITVLPVTLYLTVSDLPTEAEAALVMPPAGTSRPTMVRTVRARRGVRRSRGLIRDHMGVRLSF